MQAKLIEKTYKVKICGTTSIRDAQMAADAGADYLGVLVNVAGSERSLTPDQALPVIKSSKIPVVMLLSSMDTDGVISLANMLRPFGIHLLGQTSAGMLKELKSRLDCQIWQTVYLPAKGQGDADVNAVKDLMRLYEEAGADTIVIDTVSLAVDGRAKRYGGTGKVADWYAAKELSETVKIPVFLAGGINPDNVREAIRKVDPYGVDLASGVEKSKGVRDPDKVKRLLEEVRKASRKSFTIVSQSPEYTRKIGAEIGKKAHPGSVIALCGHLGTGKTVLAQGIASGLGIKNIVTSPTFVIINEYSGRCPFYHIDTYRLNSSEALREIGYEEYFYSDGVTVIEWAHKIEDLLPEEYLRVELKVLGECDRELVFIPFGEEYIKLVERTICLYSE